MKSKFLIEERYKAYEVGYTELQDSIRGLHRSISANRIIDEILTILKDIYDYLKHPRIPTKNDLRSQFLIQFGKKFAKLNGQKDFFSIRGSLLPQKGEKINKSKLMKVQAPPRNQTDGGLLLTRFQLLFRLQNIKLICSLPEDLLIKTKLDLLQPLQRSPQPSKKQIYCLPCLMTIPSTPPRQDQRNQIRGQPSQSNTYVRPMNLI